MSSPQTKPKDLEWQEKTSKAGAKYQTGYPPPPPPPITGSIAVDWPVGTSGNTTPEVLAATGIRSYSNQNVGGVFYTYELDFNTGQKWNYEFKDKSDDSYSCACGSTGGHWIDYNSSSPDIVEVSWSYNSAY